MIIPYPNKHSEFEIQSNLYNILKYKGYKVRGEVKVPKSQNHRGCRFDIVIYDPENLKAKYIIEVKKNIKFGYRYRTYYKRYQRFAVDGCKIRVCQGWGSFKCLFKELDDDVDLKRTLNIYNSKYEKG